MNRRQVQQLARDFGWDEPEFCTHRLTGKEAENYGAGVVEWAESQISNSFFLQINPLPRHDEDYSLCVHAIRFQICSGWRDIRLTSDHRQRRRIVTRIRPFFRFDHFATATARTDYRKAYPHSSGYTWKRIQTERTPNFMGLMQ